MQENIPYAAPSCPVTRPVPMKPMSDTAAYSGDLFVAFIRATATRTVLLSVSSRLQWQVGIRDQIGPAHPVMLVAKVEK